MKAIIVIDAQVDFITGALRNEEAIKSLPTLHKVVEWAADNRYELIYTKDTHNKNSYLASQEGKNLPVPHCIYNTPGWYIVPEAMPNYYYEHWRFYRKAQFGYTNWREAHLEDFDELIFVGYCSEICVISNILIIKSLYPEIPITFISDASAGVTPESHAAACTVMKSCQVNVKTWKEYYGMTLAKEVQSITDKTINNSIEKENQSILQPMLLHMMNL